MVRKHSFIVIYLLPKSCWCHLNAFNAAGKRDPHRSPCVTTKS